MLRNKACGMLALVALIGLSQAGFAQEVAWPPKLVRLIVPFGAGSSPDIVTRVLADSLQARHPGSNFVVENKPGASGNIGTDAIAKAAPDGGTIGISLGGPLAINTLLFARLPYNPDTDIAPITLLTKLPSVLAVPTSLGINNVAEFLAKAKSTAGGLAYGSIGAGSLSQLCMEAIAQSAAAPMVHIPYPSSPAATTALIRGDVQVACLPAIGVQSDAWNALVGPGGLSKDLVAKINAEVTQSLNEPAVIERLKLQLITSAPSSPEQLRQRMADEKRLWAEVIRAAKIRIE